MPKILSELKPRLLQEMERLLKDEGYSAVTIRSVAAGCGVGVGTVYNYFPSKEAMLAEYLLVDWRQCIANIEAVSKSSGTSEPAARCIYDELLRFTSTHTAIFHDAAAKSAFAGSFSQYHTLLRSQLAGPLARFCESEFAAEFAAESLLTWTMAGKEFNEIWDILCPLVTTK